MSNRISAKNAFELREILNGMPAKELRNTALMVKDGSISLPAVSRTYGFDVVEVTLPSGEKITHFVF